MDKGSARRGLGRGLILAGCAFFVACVGSGQAPAAPPPSTALTSQSHPAQAPGLAIALPAYEVSTVKPSKPDHQGSLLLFKPDGMSIAGVPLAMIVREAFGIEDDHVLGMPTWTKSAMFDIEAKVALEDAPRLKDLKIDQRQRMLVPLLEDRFQLKFHHETKDLPVYDLVLAKGGVKMQATRPVNDATPDPPPGLPSGPGQPPRPGSHMLTMGRGHIESTGTAMEFLAHVLSRQLGRTVVDKTGLTGNYEFKLEWTPDDAVPAMASAVGGQPAGDSASTPDTSGPSLFTAVQEQLGLKLESVKTQADVIVIDQIEQPTPN
jgi:uncharacterized protein (TIGR03435 family)